MNSAMSAPTPPAIQDAEALGVIWHTDVELRGAVRNLSSAYAPGIDNDYTQAFIIANRIIADTQRFLNYGSSNQRWNDATPDRMKEATKRVRFLEECSASYLPEAELNDFGWSPRNTSGEAKQLAAAIRGVDSEDASARAQTAELARQVLLRKPGLRARLAIAVQAGNDDQMAEVAYWLARDRFSPDYTVELAQMPGHKFCLVGKEEWPRDDWWVIDPWPRDTYPVQLQHHLGSGDTTVILSKPGKGGQPSTDQARRKAEAKDRQEPARYERIRAAMTRGLEAFQPSTAPIKGQQGVMHNSLRPSKDPIRQIYTVLIQQSDEILRPVAYAISPEHERARRIAARIIHDVKCGLKYGPGNQMWNLGEAGRAKDQVEPGVSQGKEKDINLRISFMRNPPARHLSDEELRCFAVADHKGWEYRVDLARKIKAALPPQPGTSDSSAPPNAGAASDLGKLSRDVLSGKNRLSAYAALGVQAGNCGEFAALAYTLARQRFDSTYTVMLASTLIPEHAFCMVGKNEWNRADWWVIDAWPRDPYPVLARHYFARRNIMVQWCKPAKGALHPAEKVRRYERLRAVVARRFQIYAEAVRRAPQQQAVTTDAESLAKSCYNCLYPTQEPIQWHYQVDETLAEIPSLPG
jgi:hypothetical protein